MSGLNFERFSLCIHHCCMCKFYTNLSLQLKEIVLIGIRFLVFSATWRRTRDVLVSGLPSVNKYTESICKSSNASCNIIKIRSQNSEINKFCIKLKLQRNTHFWKTKIHNDFQKCVKQITNLYFSVKITGYRWSPMNCQVGIFAYLYKVQHSNCPPLYERLRISLHAHSMSDILIFCFIFLYHSKLMVMTWYCLSSTKWEIFHLNSSFVSRHL